MMGLSKSTLQLFKECPRCFWLAKNHKLDRPRSPMPSVVNAIDGMMKAMVATALEDKMPVAYLDGMVLHPYADRIKIEKYRSWQSFQAIIQVGGKQIKIWGELDDLLEDAEGVVSPWDFKSKDSPPDQAYCDKWYQLDGDMYHLLLMHHQHQVSGKGYLTICYPTARPHHGAGCFESVTLQTDTNPDRAADLAYRAVLCLEGPLPAPTATCKVCLYIQNRKEHDR